MEATQTMMSLGQRAAPAPEEALKGRAIPQWDGVGKDLAKKIADFNSRVSATDQAYAENENRLTKLKAGLAPTWNDDPQDSVQVKREDATYVTPWDASITADEVRYNRSHRLVEALEQWEERIVLCEELTAELRELVPPLQEELEKVEAAVRRGLEDLGQGIEATIGWPKDKRVAEIQFDHLVRLNTRVRPARERVTNATGRARTATTWIADSNVGLTQAKRVISHLTQKAAQGV